MTIPPPSVNSATVPSTTTSRSGASPPTPIKPERTGPPAGPATSIVAAPANRASLGAQQKSQGEGQPGLWFSVQFGTLRSITRKTPRPSTKGFLEPPIRPRTVTLSPTFAYFLVGAISATSLGGTSRNNPVGSCSRVTTPSPDSLDPLRNAA